MVGGFDDWSEVAVYHGLAALSKARGHGDSLLLQQNFLLSTRPYLETVPQPRGLTLSESSL